MPRISVVEQYDNKDLIQQIYRLKELVETGTASNIAVTDNHDGTITVDVTMRDGSIQTFTLANDNIATIAAVQNGADVTVTVTFESGSTQSFTFNVASGKVDVLTTTGDYVYSHSGAVQGEIPVTDFVDVSGAQAITGTKTVPLETTGVFSDQIASSNKVKNELDNYAPMIRMTNAQTKAGLLTLTGDGLPGGKGLNVKVTTIAAQASVASRYDDISFMAADDTPLAIIRFNNSISPGVRGIQLIIFDGSGTPTISVLGSVTI